MKKIVITGFLGFLGSLQAQVIIGDGVGTAPAASKGSVLLEFAAGQNKGIIVPYVRTLPASPAPGTILLDASTPTNARMKYYNGNTVTGTGGYVDLSGQSADLTNTLAVQPTGIAESGKTTIGTQSAADGVLVLESAAKAMVLPIVEDVQKIVSPSPGMLVYVNKTGAKRLAVYNGAKWSFWQPAN